jgi:hypothetical protein
VHKKFEDDLAMEEKVGLCFVKNRKSFEKMSSLDNAREYFVVLARVKKATHRSSSKTTLFICLRRWNTLWPELS